MGTWDPSWSQKQSDSNLGGRALHPLTLVTGGKKAHSGLVFSKVKSKEIFVSQGIYSSQIQNQSYLYY